MAFPQSLLSQKRLCFLVQKYVLLFKTSYHPLEEVLCVFSFRVQYRHKQRAPTRALDVRVQEVRPCCDENPENFAPVFWVAHHLYHVPRVFRIGLVSVRVMYRCERLMGFVHKHTSPAVNRYKHFKSFDGSASFSIPLALHAAGKGKHCAAHVGCPCFKTKCLTRAVRTGYNHSSRRAFRIVDPASKMTQSGYDFARPDKIRH